MPYSEAKEKYQMIGFDTEAALQILAETPVSLHCWQGALLKEIQDYETRVLSQRT